MNVAPVNGRHPGQAGANLKLLIGMHGLRQAALASHIGISPAGLTNIVTGRHEPAVRTASRAATAFGISIEELCGDRGRCLRAAVVAFDTAPVRRLARAGGSLEREAAG